MLENIVVHSIQVYRVSMCLVDYLKLQGIQMDGQLVQAAALLHDITKTRSFETEENHALTGGQVLTDLGYPEIGNLVRQHVRLDDYSEPKNLAEAEIINYADKRVLHDRIVSLDERMSYIHGKVRSSAGAQSSEFDCYGRKQKIWRNRFSAICLFHRMIFTITSQPWISPAKFRAIRNCVRNSPPGAKHCFIRDVRNHLAWRKPSAAAIDWLHSNRTRGGFYRFEPLEICKPIFHDYLL